MEGNIYQIIWYVLWAVLWTVYFVLDGFDLGAGSIIYFIGKNYRERNVVYQAIGPFWDGNEVWLITAGGATFAAFPKTYAVMFSALYSALLLLLFCLIIRGVSIEYRNKYDNSLWKNLWDLAFFLSSFLATFLLGVAFANIFEGLPIDAQGNYHGSFFTLLNPYGLLGGLLFVFFFAVHGANWIAFKTQGKIAERAANMSKKLWIGAILLASAFFLFSYLATNLWNNYSKHPILFLFPLLSLIALFAIPPFVSSGKYLKAWIASGLSILGFSAWAFAGLFPNMFPSSINSAWNLTCFNSSSSVLTLKVMTVVAFIFVPIILIYTIWAYKVLHFKVSVEKS